MRRTPQRLAFVLAALLAAVPIAGGVAAAEGKAKTVGRVLIKVPAGNRSSTQPAIPGGSIKRTTETKDTFDGKYAKIYGLLQRDRTLIGNIKRVAALYRIDPVHMIGAIVGEHTYNVNSIDSLQTYYVKALEYAKVDLEFAYKGQTIDDFVRRPEFARCDEAKGEDALWSCREQVWNTTFRGKRVDGVAYDNMRFGQAFFQPLFAGQTFGLGQLNPLTALEVSSLVAATSHLPKLSASNPKAVYAAIMDPDTSLHYMAAVIRSSIDAYAGAGFDISGNPGITATLYNVGNARSRAAELAAENRGRRSSGLGPKLPVENYYGWFVNSKLDELKRLL